MRKFSNAEMVIIKRAAMTVKSLRSKEAKIDEQIQKLQKKKEELNQTVDLFEAPIKSISGGYTSIEILSGGAAAGDAVESVKAEQVIDEERGSMIEVPPAEAVKIDKDAMEAAKVEPENCSEVSVAMEANDDVPWN